MITDILDPTRRMRDEVQKQAELHESLSRIGAMYGLTFDEINDALLAAVHKKRTTIVELDIKRMSQKCVTL